MPFGPEISWPYGFRQMDSESREVLESAYGTGPVYSQPAVEDDGYGDPGYADPSYEGPRTPYGGPAFDGPAVGGKHGSSPNAATPRRSGGSGYRSPEAGLPGYYVPQIRDSARSGHAVPGYQPQGFVPPSGGQEIWPVTGAQEALPDTGPQPIAQPIAPSAADARGSGRSPQAASPAYPDQWYDNPRLNDRVIDDVRYDQPRPGGSRLSGPPAGSRPTDPRLAGMNYGELRYDPDPVPAPVAPVDPGKPGYHEPPDDESWYEELRRSAPAYPQGFGPQHPSGPQRRVEPQAPDCGQQAGFRQAPDRAAGYGKPRGDWGGPLPQAPQNPQLSAGRMTGPGLSSPGQRSGSQPGSPFPPGPGTPGNRIPQRPGRSGRTAHPAGRHPGGRPA